MTDYRLDHPPVIEAVCELRLRAGERWDSTAPGLFFAAMQDVLPQKKAGSRMRVSSPKGPTEPMIEFEVLARFESTDGKFFVQLAPNYLSIHCTDPYPGWSAFQPLVRRAIDEYFRIVNPSGTQQIGLRYINRIELPESPVEIESLFKFYPKLEQELPQNIVAARASVVFSFEQNILRLQMYTPDQGTPAVFVDLDYNTLHAPDSVGAILEWLEVAHNAVRDMFRRVLKPDVMQRLGLREVKEGELS